MLDVVFAVVAFTLEEVAVLPGLSITHRSRAKIAGQSVGENIARNQMEHIFSLQYQIPPHTWWLHRGTFRLQCDAVWLKSTLFSEIPTSKRCS